MRLHLSTWREVERYRAGSAGVIVPIGSTEQHGPIGVIGTDAICAETIALRAGEIADALVAPTISVGMAEHHMAFPGSITYRPSTLMRVVVDYVISLARHGFSRVLFVNGHGGNIPTVQAAFYEAYGAARAEPGIDAAALRCRLISWWVGEEVAAIAAELFGDRDGSHATAAEISVTRHAYAEAEKDAPLEPALAPSGSFFGPADFRRRYPDGRIGSDPSLASAAHGARLAEAAAKEIAAQYRAFLDQD